MASANAEATGPPFRFLVLGKIQRIKNPLLVVRAASHLLLAHRGQQGARGGDGATNTTSSRHVTITFVGMPFSSGPHLPDSMRELRAAIPQSLEQHFEFRDAVPRHELPEFACQYDAAIVASKFESFNMVAHELHYLGVPIIISDFVGFSGYFTDANAFLFEHGNARSLADAMREAMGGGGGDFWASSFVSGVEKTWAELRYQHPLQAYACVVYGGRRDFAALELERWSNATVRDMRRAMVPPDSKVQI